MHSSPPLLFLITSLATIGGCDPTVSPNPEGIAGNATSSGGTDATGGEVASGGTGATGGTEATGGAEAAGGTDASGGAEATGGADAGAFVTQWACDQAEGEKTVVLPLKSVDTSGGFDFTVDWGDGTPPVTIRSSDSPDRKHTYATNGPHTIRIEGELAGWDMKWIEDLGTCDLTEVTQWGSFKFGDGRFTSSSFNESRRLKITATETPDIAGATSLAFAFAGCESIDRIPGIENWDVSHITNMIGVFGTEHYPSPGPAFNQDLSGWDVSNVTNMSLMFGHTTKFNQDLSGWDVSNVKNLSAMFLRSAFNGDISSWDVSNVTNMGSMFSRASAFNRDISQWDVSSVTNMGVMFQLAESFNQDISGWDVSNVTRMQGMFRGTKSFNQDLSGWDVSNVTNMEGIFDGAEAFDQDLSAWDISNVTRWSGLNSTSALGGSGMSDANLDKLRAAGWPDEAF